MNNYLQNIELLFYDEILPLAADTFIHPSSKLTILKESVTIQKNLFRKAFPQAINGIKKEKTARLMISRCQASLVNLVDDTCWLLNQIDSKKKSLSYSKADLQNLFQHAIYSLEDILYFLEKYYPTYFNQDGKITDNGRLLLQDQSRQYIKSLTRQLKSCNKDEQYSSVLLAPFLKMINMQSIAQVSYRQTSYIKTIFKELDNYLFTNKNNLDTRLLLRQLVYLNYNEYAFVDYCIAFIKKETSSAITTRDRIEQFAWWLKTISQFQIRTDLVFDKTAPSAKEQLLNWLYDELAFFERKQQLATLVAPSVEASRPEKSFSLKTPLSVKQLGLLIRLLVDTGVLRLENQTELLNKIAAIFKTDRRETISFQSLRIRYYNIEEPTKNIVKEWLTKMTSQLGKY